MIHLSMYLPTSPSSSILKPTPDVTDLQDIIVIATYQYTYMFIEI